MDILEELQQKHFGTKVGWALRASEEIQRLRAREEIAQKLVAEYLDIYDPGDERLPGFGPGEIDLVLAARAFINAAP